MNHGPLSLKLTVVLICITSVSSAFSPSGSVSIDCGGQQTFTCTLAGNGPAAWTITGLQGIVASGTNGVVVGIINARVTSAESIPGLTSTITITGFTTADNGGTVHCVDQLGAVEGSATVAVASNTLARATAVMATVDQCSANLTWSEPSNSSATSSVSCAPSSPQCSSCTSSGCTIGGLTPNTSYTFSVSRSRCGCDDSSTSLSNTVNTVAACELANSDPISTPTTATAICILSGVVPSVMLILTNIISVVVVFIVTRHCYKKSAKGGSPSRQEELYAQVEGKKVYEDINMTDSPAYGPTSPAPPV